MADVIDQYSSDNFYKGIQLTHFVFSLYGTNYVHCNQNKLDFFLVFHVGSYFVIKVSSEISFLATSDFANAF